LTAIALSATKKDTDCKVNLSFTVVGSSKTIELGQVYPTPANAPTTDTTKTIISDLLSVKVMPETKQSMFLISKGFKASVKFEFNDSIDKIV
jgi:hypothetical protein